MAVVEKNILSPAEAIGQSLCCKKITGETQVLALARM
jgi:hypothetical protein